MAHIRTFIALELPESLKEKLTHVQNTFGQRIHGVKWVNPGNIHLTLKFLGPTSEDMLADVAGTLEQAAQGFQPFVIMVQGLGAFPNPHSPKVIWAGVRVDKQLFSFQKKLEDALASIGFAREKRSFSPHLTIGRVKDPRARKEVRSLLLDCGDKDLGSYEAGRVVFFKSDLNPTGPIYSVLKDIEFCNI